MNAIFKILLCFSLFALFVSCQKTEDSKILVYQDTLLQVPDFNEAEIMGKGRMMSKGKKLHYKKHKKEFKPQY